MKQSLERFPESLKRFPESLKRFPESLNPFLPRYTFGARFGCSHSYLPQTLASRGLEEPYFQLCCCVVLKMTVKGKVKLSFNLYDYGKLNLEEHSVFSEEGSVNQ